MRWLATRNWGRLWQSLLAFLVFMASGAALADIMTKQWFALFGLVVGGLQVATTNYQHGERRGEQKATNGQHYPASPTT